MRAWWSFAGQNDFCFVEDTDPGAIGADGRLPVPLAARSRAAPSGWLLRAAALFQEPPLRRDSSLAETIWSGSIVLMNPSLSRIAMLYLPMRRNSGWGMTNS